VDIVDIEGYIITKTPTGNVKQKACTVFLRYGILRHQAAQCSIPEN